jgi:chloramphenicol O-acetyltransferase
MMRSWTTFHQPAISKNEGRPQKLGFTIFKRVRYSCVPQFSFTSQNTKAANKLFACQPLLHEGPFYILV